MQILPVIPKSSPSYKHPAAWLTREMPFENGMIRFEFYRCLNLIISFRQRLNRIKVIEQQEV
jgi:hypothetical protein